MIEKRTLFILGAGASKPYGFPSGRELTDNIINGLEPHQSLYQHLVAADFLPDQLEGFRNGFQRSGRYSIDAFLQHRPDHSDVGRAVIAHEIMKAESHGRMYYTSADEDWYRHLVHKMNAPKEIFDRNQVAFVSFNYDRSLEYYLVQHLAGAYGLQDQEAATIVKGFTFIHLHGDVGELPWLAKDGQPYTGSVKPDEIKRAAGRIHIVHDKLAEREASFGEARRLILAAARVVVLGFGFDPINVQRLNLNQVGTSMMATAIGLTPLEKQSVVRLTDGRMKLHDLDSLALLREVVDLTA